MTLSERQREILLKTLEIHISTGSPVGSNALSEVVDASSSTIRSDLADLEARGLLTHPHTSAGRVPTDAGYRFYVDALLAGASPEAVSLETPEAYGNVDELLQGVSEGMSKVTRLLAVVAGPSALGDCLARIDHLPLGEGSLLLVVSMQSGLSSSARVSLPASVEQDELVAMMASLNSWLGGRSPGRDLELAAARKVLSDHDPLVVEAVLEAVEILGRATERGVFIQGASALLSRLDDLDPTSLAAVIEVFERRRWLLRLLGDALERSSSHPSGIVVSIGAENRFRNLSGTSLVAAAYSHHERPYGVVSLIGPRRMDYDAAISTVRSASETLTYYLNANF